MHHAINIPPDLIARAKRVSGKRTTQAVMRHALEKLVNDYEPDDGPPTDETIQTIRRLLPQSGRGKARSLFGL